MDAWDFKKWRRRHRYTQFEAADKLGMGRGAIQDWESELRPVPEAVALACCELTRRSMRHPDFGPVILVYSEDQIWDQPPGAYDIVLMKCERYPDNETAIRRTCSLIGNSLSLTAMIVSKNGVVVWGTPELLAECERRTEQLSKNRLVLGSLGRKF